MVSMSNVTVFTCSPAPFLHVSRTEDRIKKAAASMELVGKSPVWLTPAQTNAKYS